jgi:muramoyltetrapeptide carboxypeptidase LdcA involved in peptidoglycan recycling
MLKHGDRVGIVACSNGLEQDEQEQLEQLADVLERMGLHPVYSPYLFRQESVFSASGLQRANALNAMYHDDSIQVIFDISGGDIANDLLEHLDYEQIRRHPKPFFGYSDLTTIINALYVKTGISSYLYQARCLVWEAGEMQILAFQNSLFHKKDDLFCAKWEFVRGERMEGVVIGGNIRCFLKLAGTQFLPDFSEKILFLESLGGGTAQMATCLSQMKQMGVFNSISGLLLGTFTRMEKKNEAPDMVELVRRAAKDYDFPIAKTHDIGHASSSKCLMIGTKQTFTKE